VGMSALLTTTMPYMGAVIKRLEETGLRSRVHVLVGGAPLNPRFAVDIGADRYCRDASEAVGAAKAAILAGTA
jgi:methanogenic corrinoid protein MtbC1